MFDKNFAPDGYEAVEDKDAFKSCSQCVFDGNYEGCLNAMCMPYQRPDKQYAIFKIAAKPIDKPAAYTWPYDSEGTYCGG